MEEHPSTVLLRALQQMFTKDLLESYRERRISRHDVLVRLTEFMTPLDAIEQIENIDNERSST